MIKLVVFDWNGTILSDTNAVREADNELIKKFGGKQVNFNTYKQTLSGSKSSLDFYVCHGCDKNRLLENLKEAGKVQDQYYEKKALHCRTRKGTKQLLFWLHQNSIESIILSNHNLQSIHYHLKRLKMESFFSHVFAHNLPEGFLKPKDKMKKLKHYLYQHKIKPRESVIIGDSVEEIKIAKNLGMINIAIINGCHSIKRLKREKPNYLISNLTECIQILKDKIQ